jgi:hypothetical protein
MTPKKAASESSMSNAPSGSSDGEAAQKGWSAVEQGVKSNEEDPGVL